MVPTTVNSQHFVFLVMDRNQIGSQHWKPMICGKNLPQPKIEVSIHGGHDIHFNLRRAFGDVYIFSDLYSMFKMDFIVPPFKKKINL